MESVEVAIPPLCKSWESISTTEDLAISLESYLYNFGNNARIPLSCLCYLTSFYKSSIMYLSVLHEKFFR